MFAQLDIAAMVRGAQVSGWFQNRRAKEKNKAAAVAVATTAPMKNKVPSNSDGRDTAYRAQDNPLVDLSYGVSSILAYLGS